MKEEAGKKRSQRIPRFRSIEEEAEFWDTHDSTEFEDQFRPTRLKFAEHVEHLFAIPLEPKVIDLLLNVARERGIDPMALAGEFIAEGLARLGAESTKTGAGGSKKGKQHG